MKGARALEAQGLLGAPNLEIVGAVAPENGVLEAQGLLGAPNGKRPRHTWPSWAPARALAPQGEFN